MKKLFVLFISLVTFSCSISDDSPRYFQEFLPIETAFLPEEFVLDETYEITVAYTNPTTCHFFNDIFHIREDNEISVAVNSTKYQSQSNGDCTASDAEMEATFSFTPTELGTYVFKFWQGRGDDGETVYLTIEVPVAE